MIETAAQIYCRPEPSVTFHAYKANDEGAQVIVAEVAPSDIRPIYVQEDDGTQKAYIRVADENILAPELLVRAWRRQNSPQGSLLTLNAVETTVIDTIAASAGWNDLVRAAHTHGQSQPFYDRRSHSETRRNRHGGVPLPWRRIYAGP